MGHVRRFLFGLIMLVCVDSLSLHAQSEKLIVIENADSLFGKIVEGESAQELIGNVRFSQDRVRVTCDRAIQFRQSGNVQLNGNVVVLDDSVTMRFPSGMFLRDVRRAVAYDSVQLDDGKVTLTARFGEYVVDSQRAFFKTKVVAKDAESTLKSDSLTYYRAEERIVAMGKVEITSDTDKMTIRGNHFESWRNQNYSRMTETPVLVKFDTTASTGTIDTLVVRSTVMEAYRDSLRRLLATGNVQIVRSDLAAICGAAEFFSASDSMYLRKTPVIWYEKTQVSGDSINVYLLRKRIDSLNVEGNALAISQSDSLHANRFDQLSGERMVMRFGEAGVRQIDVKDRAVSVYHLYEDSLANGLNKTSGDRIVLLWEGKTLDAIKVYGGVEGQYFPENLVEGKEKDFAVSGFNWTAERPVLRETDFRFEKSGTKKTASGKNEKQTRNSKRRK